MRTREQIRAMFGKLKKNKVARGTAIALGVGATAGAAYMSRGRLIPYVRRVPKYFDNVLDYTSSDSNRFGKTATALYNVQTLGGSATVGGLGYLIGKRRRAKKRRRP